jgi:hypothetical protein
MGWKDCFNVASFWVNRRSSTLSWTATVATATPDQCLVLAEEQTGAAQ